MVAESRSAVEPTNCRHRGMPIVELFFGVIDVGSRWMLSETSMKDDTLLHAWVAEDMDPSEVWKAI